MVNITVSDENGLVHLRFEPPGAEPTIVKMSPETAAQIGAALIGCSNAPMTGSLFDHAQMISSHNPRVEVRRSDTGQLVVALGPADLRPILLQFDHEAAEEFVRLIASAL